MQTETLPLRAPPKSTTIQGTAARLLVCGNHHWRVAPSEVSKALRTYGVPADQIGEVIYLDGGAASLAGVTWARLHSKPCIKQDTCEGADYALLIGPIGEPETQLLLDICATSATVLIYNQRGVLH